MDSSQSHSRTPYWALTGTDRARAQWLFWATLGAFVAIYLIFYPRTYSIKDEAHTLTLAYSIAHGTIFLDHAAPFMGFRIAGHVVTPYSPFHAALLAIALAVDWRLSFLVTAAFFVLGAFVIRAMLARDGLTTHWSVLYFLLAGALYYSQTVIAVVPAAVMGLLGVAMLMREEPRCVAGGLAFGASVLLHPWMAPMAVVFSAVRCLERGAQTFRRNASAITVGAAPSMIALGAYNYATVGSPFRNVYVSLGHLTYFSAQHLYQFAGFYIASLAVFPLGGWAVLSRRWCRGLALPAAAGTMLLLASLYNWREGYFNLGSARVGAGAAFVAGLIPGQRFLLPVSIVACLPAARFVDARLGEAVRRWSGTLAVCALALFSVGFTLVSVAHRAYIDAHGVAQQALLRALPANGQIVLRHELALDDLAKELAPVLRVYTHVDTHAGHVPRTAYLAYLARPGERPPEHWLANRRVELVRLRSWAWNRDLWIGAPATGRTDSLQPSAGH